MRGASGAGDHHRAQRLRAGHAPFFLLPETGGAYDGHRHLPLHNLLRYPLGDRTSHPGAVLWPCGKGPRAEGIYPAGTG